MNSKLCPIYIYRTDCVCNTAVIECCNCLAFIIKYMMLVDFQNFAKFIAGRVTKIGNFAVSNAYNIIINIL